MCFFSFETRGRFDLPIARTKGSVQRKKLALSSTRSIILRDSESIFSEFSTIILTNSAVHQNRPQVHFRTVDRHLDHY